MYPQDDFCPFDYNVTFPLYAEVFDKIYVSFASSHTMVKLYKL